MVANQSSNKSISCQNLQNGQNRLCMKHEVLAYDLDGSSMQNYNEA